MRQNLRQAKRQGRCRDQRGQSKTTKPDHFILPKAFTTKALITKTLPTKASSGSSPAPHPGSRRAAPF
ncbi:hypothetical protein C7U92_27580 [Bradyrhizobium sp. WBOS7]|nr:hypothetical protein [Bradyrhizobium sp. WBOS7]MDD1603757.1 hypothetical protein [Bradyrhizobium sp. WBOS16]UUO33852.1 hypothetical protein DCK84_04190 [Bradyrhizobium sp. WBOS01]UUO40283.1 hypothetical protein DCM75_05625 [Bradyrhizobium sp. WBOS02]